MMPAVADLESRVLCKMHKQMFIHLQASLGLCSLAVSSEGGPHAVSIAPAVLQSGHSVQTQALWVCRGRGILQTD